MVQNPIFLIYDKRKLKIYRLKLIENIENCKFKCWYNIKKLKLTKLILAKLVPHFNQKNSIK